MEKQIKNNVRKDDMVGVGIIRIIADILTPKYSEEMLREKEEDMPKASPLDLLSAREYKRMDEYLNKYFKHLRSHIDENYVALLMKVSEYDKTVDFGAKISAHIKANIRAKLI